MDILTSRYYKLLRLFLSFYGLKPDLQPRQKLIQTIFVNFNLWTLLILQILNFVTMEYKGETLIEVLACLLPCISIAISYYTMYIKQKQMWELMYEIDRDYELKDPEEVKIIAKYADEWRLYVQMLIVSMFVFYLMLYNVPILFIVVDIIVPSNKTRARQLPIMVECFIDRDKYFYEIFFFVYLLAMENGTMIIVIFATFLIFTQHARGLFHIVGYVVEHIFDHGSSSCFKNRHAEIYKSVVRVIRSHEKAISFVERLNSAVEITYLINMSLAIFVVGISFVKVLCISSTSNETKQLIISISYGLGNFTWIYINCYIGQRILDQSEAIFENICQVPWYLTSQKTQKLSLLMIQRSIKPSYLSVGKIFVASHELFSGVVQTSLSYAAVYYSVR